MPDHARLSLRSGGCRVAGRVGEGVVAKSELRKLVKGCMRVRHVRLRILRCLYPLRVCSVCGKVSGGCRATHLRRVVGAGLPT
jgi:hypothetical protein